MQHLTWFEMKMLRWRKRRRKAIGEASHPQPKQVEQQLQTDIIEHHATKKNFPVDHSGRFF